MTAKLQVQEFLETHTLQNLISLHGCYASLSKDHKKISLNYEMVETKDGDKLAGECRGLILAHADHSEFKTIDDKIDTNVVVGITQTIAVPMFRFYNNGQGAAYVDWNDPNLAIFEKLDGTLSIIHFDPISNLWQMGTRRVCEADLPMENGIYTFRGLFEKALFETSGMTWDQFTSHLDKNFTYCFELTSPLNELVVKYKDYRVTLLAARDLRTLQEVNINTISIPNVPHVKAFSPMTVSEIVSFVSAVTAFEREGVVVLDSKFNRIKIKNPEYGLYSRLRDALGKSERNCLELILLGKDDDVIGTLPQEIADILTRTKAGVAKMIRDHNEAYTTIYNECQAIKPNDKKTFAIAVQNVAKARNGKLWTAPLFNMYDKKSNNMMDFIEKNKKEGTWGDTFLDKILDIVKEK